MEIEGDILYQVPDYVDYDNIKFHIEEEILSQVNDHVDFEGVDLYHRTDELDMDEIRWSIENDILSNVDEHIDYDEIMSRVNDEMFEENENRMNNIEESLELMRNSIKTHQAILENLYKELEEARMSVWSRIVRYVRGWF